MYRKFSPELIFSGKEFLNPGYSLITTEDGTVIDIVNDISDGEVLNGILTPGFINCHCHLELSHLKNKISTGTGLVEFVQQVMKLRFEPDEIKTASMKDAVELIYNSGTVAVGDICNSTDSIPFKNNTIKWRNFIEVSGFVDSTAGERFNAAEKVSELFEESFITPHAPYSVSKSLFKLIAENNKSLISIHNQESNQEDLLYKFKNGDFLNLFSNLGIDISKFEETGKSSFKSWLPFFNNETKILSVHNTFTSDSDLIFARENNYNISFCICLIANLYIENKLPPVDLLRANNCKLVIGTDSLASNFKLNILEEIKAIKNKFPSIPLQEILKWATFNGAETLGFNELGLFEKGKRPGIVLIENANEFDLAENAVSKRIL